MEISQLEYFITSVNEGSFYKASQKLFVSQPAISKSISLLEKELNQRLLERTSHGLKLTPHGEKLYHYAKNILRQIDIIKQPLSDLHENRLAFASYPSRLIATSLTDYYRHKNGAVEIEYLEGTVQDIINYVYTGICEFGIAYISPKQAPALEHILSHKHLEFVALKASQLCIYVGEEHPLYGSSQSISVKELAELCYIRGIHDFFSVEHHFDYVSLNEIDTAYFNDKVLTNSDHLVTQMLEHTDLCYLGIDTKGTKSKAKIEIDSETKHLTLGYIRNKSSQLSCLSTDFLAHLEQYI